MSKKKVCILTYDVNPEWGKFILQEKLEIKGLDVDVIDLKNNYKVKAGLLFQDKKPINVSSYSGVMFYAFQGDIAFSEQVLKLFEDKGVYSYNPHNGVLNANDKTKTSAAMKEKSVAIPKTIEIPIGKTKNVTKEKIELELGDPPYVIKPNRGARGAGVIKVDSAEEAVGRIKSGKCGFVVQKFIDTTNKEGFVSHIRCIVICGEVKAAIKYTASNKDEFRSHQHLGSKGEKLDITDQNNKELVQLAKNASDAAGLRMSGVDIAIDSNTGVPYVLEVNSSPYVPPPEEFGFDGYQMLADDFADVVKSIEKVNARSIA